MKQQLSERLAALHIEIDESVAQDHLDTVAQELSNPSAVVPFRTAGRTRLATLLAAALLLLVPAAAFAAEGAVPGDLLYPIKLATEQIRLVVDPNIEAEHRIEELETVVDRVAPFDEVADRLIDAEDSVRDSDVPEDLLGRLDSVRDRIAADYERDVLRDDGPRGDDRSGGARPDRVPPPTTAAPTTIPPETTVTTDAPQTDRPSPTDVATTTTTIPTSTDRPAGRATTTTTSPGDRNQPPQDGQG